MDLYFLIPEIIAQIFSPNVELVITTATLTNEANAEIEMQPLNAETKIRKCSQQFKALDTFLCF